MEQLAVFRVHYENLEQYIEKVYGFDFDFLMATGGAQGICPDYIVDGRLPETSGWIQQAAELRSGRRTRNVVLILAILCQDGYIPRGKYTVNTHAVPNLIGTYTGILNRVDDPNDKECLLFKSIHSSDKKFLERARTLDNLWYLKQAKRQEAEEAANK